MTRSQLEHVIRAAASVADEKELVVLGSQSILGQFPEAPAALLVSNEANLYPRHRPDLADLIDGTLGELSPFHESFGYYAHGVGPETAVLPKGWESRLIAICSEHTYGATGWCLEVHDLVVSKLVAGRPKDLDFSRVACEEGLVAAVVLQDRLSATELEAELRVVVEDRLQRVSRV